jgi:glycosyltransferase involved in cell wall biosynthesis
MLSIIINAFNTKELSVTPGNELIETIADIRAKTLDYEIIVIDDGSTDGCCDGIEAADVRVIKHDKRIGIAYSRNEGAAAAKGDAFCFLDSHHLMTEGCINKCCDAAIKHNAIIWPCVRGLEDREPPRRNWTGHGAHMAQKINEKRGLFEGKWKRRRLKPDLSRSATLMVPGYCIPREVWPQVRPADGLSGWGATEPAISVRAFFACVDILHLCGPMCRHGFRPGTKIPYTTRWDVVVRNHATTAFVCFSDLTWRRYWKRRIYRKWLKGKDWDYFDTPLLREQHDAFQLIKKRPDSHFWSHLIGTDVPQGVASKG